MSAHEYKASQMFSITPSFYKEFPTTLQVSLDYQSALVNKQACLQYQNVC